MHESSPQGPSSSVLSRIPLAALLLIFLFFLGSGACGLVYEVIWTRMLLTVFGATLYAVSTVLAAYMGGLALGSYLGGKLSDRLARPLRAYGILEIVIAAFALLVPVILRLFDPIYRSIYATGDASFFQLSLIRFALSFLTLLIPTTCMGATLPLLSRFLVRSEGSMGGRIGALYATNTLGAVLGAALSGFVLIAMLGIAGTIMVAAALSTLVGVGAWILSHFVEEGAIDLAAQRNLSDARQSADGNEGNLQPDVHQAIPAWISRVVLASYCLAGFVALAYQVFWSRTLVFRFEHLKNTTYAFSAMLTVFLGGMALGSALMAAAINRQRNPVRLYGLIQVLTGLSGAFSLFALIYLLDRIPLPQALDPETFDFNWLTAVGNVFARTFITIGLPTFLMGMAFPVVARICVRHLESVGSGIGRIYAFNTIGAILGSFAAGFLLIPLLGLSKGLLLLGVLNIFIGLVVLAANPTDTPRQKAAWAILALAVFGAFFYRIPKQYFFHNLEPGEKEIVFYKEGPLATVAVAEGILGYRTIYIDNVGVAGTDRVLLTDQKSLAHVPMLFLSNPKAALTVGFGSGGASSSYTLYPELERIDCIEICDTVLEAAPFLKDSNHGVLDRPVDPRFRVIIDDVRSYLRFADAKYDVIATDCTDLRYKSNANLYDVEYFELCKKAITEEGMVVVWMPLGGMSREVLACALKTFAHVFPDMTIWYMNNEPTHYALLIGTLKPLEIDVARMLERIGRPEIQKDLAEVALQQPEKILSCFLESAPELKDFLGPALLNTENRPHLEFESPKYGYTDEPLLVNIDILRGKRGSVRPYLRGAENQPGFLERLGRFERAVDAILEGHANYRRMNLSQACREYLKAAAIAPEDEGVRHALEFSDLKKRAEVDGSAVWAHTALGEVELLKGNPEAAANAFDRALQKLAGDDELHLLKRSVDGLAKCYEALGRPESARRIQEEYAPRLRQ